LRLTKEEKKALVRMILELRKDRLHQGSKMNIWDVIGAILDVPAKQGLVKFLVTLGW